MRLQAAMVLAALLTATMALAQGPGTWGEPISTDKAKAYPVQWTDQPLTLDGKLDEPVWQKAVAIEGFLCPPEFDAVKLTMTRPRPATSRTHARLLWDDRYLYLAAEMEDRDIYCVTGPGHDLSFGTDDIVELFVKPSDDLPYYWELHVVPTGGTRDYFYARRGAGADQRWMAYESGMQARATMVGTFDDWSDRDNKWLVELRVPWSAFAQMGGMPKAGDLWRFMVSRYDYSVHLEQGCELSAAAPLSKVNFHLFEDYPYMRFVR